MTKNRVINLPHVACAACGSNLLAVDQNLTDSRERGYHQFTCVRTDCDLQDRVLRLPIQFLEVEVEE